MLIDICFLAFPLLSVRLHPAPVDYIDFSQQTQPRVSGPRSTSKVRFIHVYHWSRSPGQKALFWFPNDRLADNVVIVNIKIKVTLVVAVSCGYGTFCLWWAMPPNKSHRSGWDTIWVPADHVNLCQTHCKQVPDYLRVYMGCALAIVFQVRSLYVPS